MGNLKNNVIIILMNEELEYKIQNLKQKAFSGFFWIFAERTSAQLVSMIVSIVLARILIPEDYAAVSIVMIFFAFSCLPPIRTVCSCNYSLFSNCIIHQCTFENK